MLRSLLTCVATCLVIVGCAGTPKPATATATAASIPKTNCAGLMSTDSRIPQSNCAPGQSYTQADLQRTGQQDTAKALQSLDSTVQIHH